MPKSQKARHLTAEDVMPPIDTAQWRFTSTSELEPLQEIVGQPRALQAFDLGLGIRHPSYNIYVAGMSGMGKKGMIRGVLARRAAQEPTPPDWVYLNNFQEPDRPLAFALPAGSAARFKADLDSLVERLTDELPQVFQAEDLTRHRQRISQQFQNQFRESIQSVERSAREKNLTVQQHPSGKFALLPLKDGEPMTEEQVDELSEEQRAEIVKHQQELAEQVSMLLVREAELREKLHEKVREIERQVAAGHIRPRVDEFSARHRHPTLGNWLEQLKQHMIEHWHDFLPPEQPPEQMAAMLGASLAQHRDFPEYRVNVLVDNGGVQGAPVVIEDAPNYKNLFGIIERGMDRLGRDTGDFHSIKAGTLLKANGGYLVLNLSDALIEPVVWKELKRTIKRRSLQIEAYEPLGWFSTTALKPEPIPLDVKLVVIGNPLLYHILYLSDEDFADIFKVKAEFDPEMPRDEAAGLVIGRMFRKLTQQEPSLLPFHADGIAEMLWASARLVEHQGKVTTEFSRLADLGREACYWASRDGSNEVRGPHVRKALEQRVYRSNLVAEKLREMIAEGSLRITLEGSVVGQINGLSVADLGDHAFGRPMRLTAAVGVGSGGIINIERESKLSGRTYDKGILILEGYLRSTYAGEHPLALSASLAMEQSYGMIDGDSATAAELLCLLSALASLPLRQELAITGSVNQRGQIQAIGGVNAKIEGMFDVCRQYGLTGRQGVVIPDANVKNLVLRPDVVEAIRQGRFHVWSIEHIDQALELFTEVPAGDLQTEGSVHWRVDQRLRELLRIRQTEGSSADRLALAGFPMPEPPLDPRPPLPGRNQREERRDDGPR